METKIIHMGKTQYLWDAICGVSAFNGDIVVGEWSKVDCLDCLIEGAVKKDNEAIAELEKILDIIPDADYVLRIRLHIKSREEGKQNE